jgi:hypothetical protein
MFRLDGNGTGACLVFGAHLGGPSNVIWSWFGNGGGLREGLQGGMALNGAVL